MVRLNNAIETKTAIGAITAVFGYLSGCLNELLVVLAILMVFDYILGTVAGLLTEGFNKEKGIKGIIKKIGYLFLVTLGFLVDFTLSFIGKSAGGNINTNGMFGYAVTCYLIGTEGLSCLKALNILGLPVPEFLSKAFGGIKDSAESKDGEQ